MRGKVQTRTRDWEGIRTFFFVSDSSRQAGRPR